MKPRAATILALAAAVIFAAAGSLVAADAPKEPVLMQVPEGATATKEPVSFPHAKHVEIKCEICHHTWDGASAVKSCDSPGCHADFKSKSGPESYYASYHDRKADHSCIGCHWTRKKAGETAGPTGCPDCHPKK